MRFLPLRMASGARADALRHDLDHGRVSFARHIRSADFRGHKPQRSRGRGAGLHPETMIELELKKIRRALKMVCCSCWKWDRAAAVKPL